MSLFQKPFFQSRDGTVEQRYTEGVSALQRGDFQGANERFKAAAEGGHVSALYNMSLLNGAGFLSPYNLDLAIDCYYKAAQGGHSSAKEDLWLLEAAERGGFGTQNLAKYAETSLSDGVHLPAMTMMCAARFFDVLCKMYGAASDVIGYELDAARTSDNPAVLAFVERTGIRSSFYENGMNRVISGSAADQITDGLNQLWLGMRKSGLSEETALMARCTIVGHLIAKSPFSSSARPLLGVRDFFA
ncbi:hypothetical protein [Burkholderia cepacia]|uniref:hypothetical protein n=1 Tax=Burkholderia cepacia TaxID=292 RepID=UPI003EE11CAA